MHVDLRPQPQRPARSPLWHLNAALAAPIAWLFGLLGVAPGQLSLQSVTLTAVGLLRAAGGEWTHVAQGAGIVYLGVLVDRADDLLAERATVTAWSRFLGLLADRLVECALVVALGWIALRTDAAAWPLATPHFLIVVAALLAALLLAQLVAVYGDLLVLRIHLARTRRLPGPAEAVDAAAPRLARLFDRDFLVLAWTVGVVAQQVQVAAFVMLGAQALVLVEAVPLFWSRRRDPEPHAARVLARGP